MNQGRTAFSLVELLVVIAIITVLTTIIVPVTMHVQTAAMRATCQSHLRQMVHGALSWATEHKGAFPPGLLHGSNRDCLSGDVRAWDWHRGPGGTVRPGVLWEHVSGVHAHGVLNCPTAPTTDASWSGDPVTGYNYNVAFVAGEARAPSPDDRGLGAMDLLTPKANLDGLTHLTLAQCRRAQHTALFGVGGRRGGVNKFMRSPVNVGPQYDIAYAGGQAFPAGSNVGWIDGAVSVAHVPWAGEHAQALPGWIVDQLAFPTNGFLSNDTRAYDPR